MDLQEMLGGVVPNGPGAPGASGTIPNPGGNGGGGGASSGASSAAGSVPASPWSSPLMGRKSLVASSGGIQGGQGGSAMGSPVVGDRSPGHQRMMSLGGGPSGLQ